MSGYDRGRQAPPPPRARDGFSGFTYPDCGETTAGYRAFVTLSLDDRAALVGIAHKAGYAATSDFCTDVIRLARFEEITIPEATKKAVRMIANHGGKAKKWEPDKRGTKRGRFNS